MELHFCINILAIPKASPQMDLNEVGSIKCIGIKCVSNPLQKRISGL